MKHFGFILFTSVLLSACAHNGAANLQAKNLAYKDYIATNNIENVDKISSFKFRGWNSLTDEFLIISSSPKRQYLIEMSGYCSDIRWTHTLLINRATNSTLHAKFDSLSSIESPQVNCRINTIYPLTQEQVKDIKAIEQSSNEGEAEPS